MKDWLPIVLLGWGAYLLMVARDVSRAPGPRRPSPWAISQLGVDKIKQFEGYSPQVYLDQAGLPTVGYGHLVRSADNLRVGDRITATRAESLLRDDLGKHEGNVNMCITSPLAQNEYDALVSFDFNTGGLCNSTLRTKLNAGEYRAVRGELARWNKVTVGGQKVVSNGLTNRRMAEADIFDRGYA